MSLPATDAFARTDGALGSNWTGSVGSDLTISSQEVTGVVATDSSMYWSADSPNADQYAQCEISNNAASYYRGPLARASTTDWVVLDANSAGNQWSVEWYNGGSWTVIGSAYSTAPAANDIGKITASSTTFKGYINGTERISGSNASAPSTGYGGMYVYSNGGRVDDFEVGNLGGGATNIPLDTAQITASGKTTTITKGAVTKALDAALLTATGKALTVSAPFPPTTINLDAATLSAIGQALTVVKGTATTPLDTAVITATGNALTVLEGAVTIALDTASITTTGQSLVLAPGVAIIPIDLAQILFSGQQLTVVPGEAITMIDLALLIASGQAISVDAGTGGIVIELDIG